MKQNSSIVFHSTLNSLKKCYFRRILATVFTFTFCLCLWSGTAAEIKQMEPYKVDFDPAKGFKPAQTDLSEIFLQIAGSLEFYGSPIPYLRHMKEKHAKFDAEYQRKIGTSARSFCPEYLDDVYLTKSSANWDKLSPKIGLGPMCKQIGALMVNAIKNEQNSGTVVSKIFNQHQKLVFDFMVGKASQPVDFDRLESELISQLQLNNPEGMQSEPKASKPGGVDSCLAIQSLYAGLFKKLDAALSRDDADRVKTVITSITIDVGRVAQSELEVGIMEWALHKHGEETTSSYKPDKEIGLSDSERKIFVSLLQKDRFTKSDFPILEKFYSTAYDKLSEHGKDELSRRVWAGMRPKQ